MPKKNAAAHAPAPTEFETQRSAPDNDTTDRRFDFPPPEPFPAEAEEAPGSERRSLPQDPPTEPGFQAKPRHERDFRWYFARGPTWSPRGASTEDRKTHARVTRQLDGRGRALALHYTKTADVDYVRLDAAYQHYRNTIDEIDEHADNREPYEIVRWASLVGALASIKVSRTKPHGPLAGRHASPLSDHPVHIQDWTQSAVRGELPGEGEVNRGTSFYRTRRSREYEAAKSSDLWSRRPLWWEQKPIPPTWIIDDLARMHYAGEINLETSTWGDIRIAPRTARVLLEYGWGLAVNQSRALNEREAVGMLATGVCEHEEREERAARAESMSQRGERKPDDRGRWNEESRALVDESREAMPEAETDYTGKETGPLRFKEIERLGINAPAESDSESDAVNAGGAAPRSTSRMDPEFDELMGQGQALNSDRAWNPRQLVKSIGDKFTTVSEISEMWGIKNTTWLRDELVRRGCQGADLKGQRAIKCSWLESEQARDLRRIANDAARRAAREEAARAARGRAPTRTKPPPPAWMMKPLKPPPQNDLDTLDDFEGG